MRGWQSSVKRLPGVELSAYTDTTLSAATVFSANTFGLMNTAPFAFKSASVTPRATEHRPQTKIGTPFATTASSMSRSGAIATGITAAATSSFMR